MHAHLSPLSAQTHKERSEHTVTQLNTHSRAHTLQKCTDTAQQILTGPQLYTHKLAELGTPLPQRGPQGCGLAEFLSYPHLCGSSRLQVTRTQGSFTFLLKVAYEPAEQGTQRHSITYSDPITMYPLSHACSQLHTRSYTCEGMQALLSRGYSQMLTCLRPWSRGPVNPLTVGANLSPILRPTQCDGVALAITTPGMGVGRWERLGRPEQVRTCWWRWVWATAVRS